MAADAALAVGEVEQAGPGLEVGVRAREVEVGPVVGGEARAVHVVEPAARPRAGVVQDHPHVTKGRPGVGGGLVAPADPLDVHIAAAELPEGAPGRAGAVEQRGV
ncbi:MAG: hypothetical protein ACK559_28885, partial [bacterium]